MTRFRTGFGVASLAFAVLCSAAPAAYADDMHFRVDMNGKQETPPNTTSGHGMGTVTYNDQSHMLTWNITYDGLTGDATAAHFHGPAKTGEAAKPTVPIKPDALKSPISGSATITEDQAAQLASGMWYFNVHTKANPGGEIRGQVEKVVSP